MKIINQHLGLPVISLDTSERAGDVVRFITDQVSGRIVAVAVNRKWYQEPHGVLFEDCRAFGQNVVLISRLDALRPLSQMEDVGLHLEAVNDARQRTAITEGGRLLGSVTDEAFDEETGEVSGYRLDILAETGTSRTVFIPHATFITSSAAVAILREDVLRYAVNSLEALGDEGVGDEGPGIGDEGLGAGDEGPEVGTAPEAVGAVGAWPGADAVAYAAPAEVTGAPDEPEPTAPAVAEEPAPVLHSPFPIPHSPIPGPSSLLSDEEALFADMEPAGEDIVVEPEDFAPTTPDYEPDVEESPVPSAPPAPDVTPPADAMGGHNRVMMALSLGRIAGATLHDPDGNVLVEKGQKITMEVAQAAARADSLYDLWTAAQEPTEG